MAAAAFFWGGTLTRTLLCWYNYGKNTVKGRQKDDKRTAKVATIIERLSNAHQSIMHRHVVYLEIYKGSITDL